MAVTETSVANRALSKLGAQRVASLADDSRNARALNACFAAVRDAELRKHLWSFAIARASLAAAPDAPEFGFARRFPLPADALRLIAVGEGVADYALEAGAVLADAAAPLNLRYLRRVEDPALFDPLFAEVLACALAVELAEELTQSDARKAFAANQYRAAVREAARVNAIEMPVETMPEAGWLAVRR